MLRVGSLDRAVAGHIGHRRQRAEPKALGRDFDPAVPLAQAIDVHEPGRTQDIELHQVDQGRATGEELRGRIALAAPGLRPQARRLRQAGGALIGEGAHQARSIRVRACLMAATMFG
jgi:hypothetical protein